MKKSCLKSYPLMLPDITPFFVKFCQFALHLSLAHFVQPATPPLSLCACRPSPRAHKFSREEEQRQHSVQACTGRRWPKYYSCYKKITLQLMKLLQQHPCDTL